MSPTSDRVAPLSDPAQNAIVRYQHDEPSAPVPGSMRDPALAHSRHGSMFRGRHLVAGVLCCALVPAVGALMSAVAGTRLPSLGPASASASTSAHVAQRPDPLPMGSLRSRDYNVTMYTTDAGIRYTVRSGPFGSVVAEGLTQEQAAPYLSGGATGEPVSGPLMLAVEREMPQ